MRISDWSKRSLILSILIAAYAIMWIGGVGHYVLIGRPPLDAPWAASVFLLLAGLIVAVSSCGNELLSLVAAASLGFIAEIIGVRFGFIFSEYFYTQVLQPHLLGVPLVMLSAWMVLVAYIRQMLMDINLPPWLEAALAAAWMTAIDLVIDPLAANQLGYWRWAKAGPYYGVPLHNFAGWFIVSLIIFLLVRGRPRVNRMSRYVGLTIVIFFAAIAFSYGLILAGTIGVALCLLHLSFSTNASALDRIIPSA